uniref:Uncharacterized protein n=1 Tax=Oryza brachyantha TaxID=4533 RepID=J3L364_ORYBR
MQTFLVDYFSNIQFNSVTVSFLTLGNLSMKFAAFASLAALLISSSVASSLPYVMLSLMEVIKSRGSWLTRPIFPLIQSSLSFLMLIPSIKTSPDCGS